MTFAAVRLERRGTRVEIQSQSLELEQLVAVARSLEPAAIEPSGIGGDPAG